MTDSVRATGNARILAAGNFQDQVLAPDGKSLLASQRDGTVTRFDLATGEIVGSWHVGTHLGGMSISPDGRYLYATELEAFSASRDPLSGYVTNVVGVRQLDLNTGQVTTFQTSIVSEHFTQFFDVVASSDGTVTLDQFSSQYIGGDNFYSLDPTTGSFTPKLGFWSDDPSALTATPDGSRVLVAPGASSAAELYIYSPTAGMIARHVDYDDGVYGPNTGAVAISATGALVAQAAGVLGKSGSDIYIYDSSLNLQVELNSIVPEVGGKWRYNVVGLAFSPNESSLYVLNAGAAQVFKLSTTDWSVQSVINVTPLTTGDVGISTGPHISSPFGDRLGISADGHYLTIQSDTALQTVDLSQVTPTPVLTSFLAPERTDIGQEGGTLTLTAGALDASSMVSSVTITFDRPIITTTGAIDHVTIDGANGSFADGASSITLDLTFGAVGHHSITSVLVTDAAGHASSYDAAALGAQGSTTSFTIGGIINLSGGDDNVSYAQTEGPLAIVGLQGNDVIVGSSGDDVITGNQGADTLLGTAGNDVVSGGQGDDLVYGGQGDDELHGNIGDDTLEGGLGNNTMFGDDGHDTVSYSYSTGSVGVDLSYYLGQSMAGTISDVLVSIENATGSAYDDVLYGDAGANTLIGGEGFDRISGREGDDTIIGNQGPDSLVGGSGADIIYGGQDSDYVLGDDGNDALFGNLADDVVIGGTGSDIMTGGAGTDIFRFTTADDSPASAPDIITDFQSTIDKIDLVALHTGSADSFSISSSGGNTFISVDLGGNGTTDLLIEVNGANAVTGDDILFDPLGMSTDGVDVQTGADQWLSHVKREGTLHNAHLGAHIWLL